MTETCVHLPTGTAPEEELGMLSPGLSTPWKNVHPGSSTGPMASSESDVSSVLPVSR